MIMQNKPQKKSVGETIVIGIDKRLYYFECSVSLVCLIAMIFVVLYGIVMRFVFRAPNPYGEELSRYLMICFIYLGVSLNVRSKGHLAVEMIVDLLPTAGQKACKIVADIISILAYGAFTYLAYILIRNMLKVVQYSTQMRMPMWVIYMALLVGFALATLRSLLLFWNDYIAKNRVLGLEDRTAISEEVAE